MVFGEISDVHMLPWHVFWVKTGLPSSLQIYSYSDMLMALSKYISNKKKCVGDWGSNLIAIIN